MLNSDEQKRFTKMFEETFGYLLNEFEDAQKELPEEEKETSLRNEKIKKTELKKIIPFSSNDKQHSGYSEKKQTTPPLNSEQEARAVAVALQEICKMKEFTTISYNHQNADFNCVYTSYPLLFAKKFEQVYSDAHQKIENMTVDAEHFICGNFHNCRSCKEQFETCSADERKMRFDFKEYLAFYYKRK